MNYLGKVFLAARRFFNYKLYEMKNFNLLFLLGFILLLASCDKKEEESITINPYHDAYEEAAKVLNLPEIANDYTVHFPAYLNNNSFFPASVNNSKATLGRVLFYDKNLSKTKEVSCASCHQQDKGFADGKQFSDGVSGRKTTRNSIGLGSTVNFGAYYGTASFFNINFFWDDRATSVAEQSRGSLTNSKEMDMDMDLVEQRVKENEKYYKWLFMEAYADGINEDNILDAIQQFVNSMGSYQSEFDKGMNANNGQEYNQFSNFSTSENRGKKIFMDNCTSCHSKFAARSSVPMANNGLAMTYADKGKGALTNNSYDDGVFKVPSLRNLSLTAPYMHDGSIATLEEVVEHYSTGIVKHKNLHNNLKSGDQPKHLNLSAEQKADLVNFLRTFDDETIASDERYSDPFK